MAEVITLLIERNALIREGLKSLLGQSHYDVMAGISSASEISSAGITKANLVVCGVDGHADEIQATIREIKSKLPDARVVVLSLRLDSAIIRNSFSAGADGFILKDISSKAFIGSLDLVMMGEKVFPTSMASLLAKGWDSWITNFSAKLPIDYDLSGRELEIIACLANGDTNKCVARKLDITESTVKVHLKTILRKLGLCNRTQAAIWAVRNGIVPCPNIEVHQKPASAEVVQVAESVH